MTQCFRRLGRTVDSALHHDGSPSEHNGRMSLYLFADSVTAEIEARVMMSRRGR
jgi:hypothetical protein